MADHKPNAGVRGAKTLCAFLDNPSSSDADFLELLLGEGLPGYLEASQDPFQAIVVALRHCPEIDRDEQDVRRQVAWQLARLIDSKPEEDPNEPYPGKIMYNMFTLAAVLPVPDILSDALASAIERYESYRTSPTISPNIDTSYEGDTARRFLITAAIHNPNGSRLRNFWQAMLQDVDGHSAGMRHYWACPWRVAMAGVTQTPNLQGVERAPSLVCLGKAIPFIAQHLEKDLPKTPDTQLRDNQFDKIMENFCGQWEIPRGLVTVFIPLIAPPPRIPKEFKMVGSGKLMSSLRRRASKVNFDEIYPLLILNRTQRFTLLQEIRKKQTNSYKLVAWFWSLQDYTQQKPRENELLNEALISDIYRTYIPDETGLAEAAD